MTLIYVTAYAITTGVFTKEANVDGTYASWWEGGFHQSAYGKGFWLTEAEAKVDFERRRLVKISSLKKQLSKLETMTFSVK